MRKTVLSQKKILVGICGSIAAYKTCELVRTLVKEEASVYILFTKNASKFVTSLTLKTLSGHPVIQDIFDEAEFSSIMHIQIAHWADLMIITPASADVISKIACGLADDVITTTVLATKAPVIFAPAMNDQMYENKIFQGNIKKLKSYGYHFIEPGIGDLACGYEGIGRLANLEDVFEKICLRLKKG